MNHAYRSEYDHVVGSRIAAMRDTHNLIEPIVPQLQKVQRARIARAIAGAVGLLGVLASCVVGISDAREELTYTFLGSLAAMVASYFVVRVLLGFGALVFSTRARNKSAELPLPPLTGRVHDDLLLLDANEPIATAEKKLARIETYSTALPLAALSMLMPLTLHYLFTLVVDNGSASSFAEWIRISFVVVGHAHLALAILAVRFAMKLRRMPLEEIQAMSINREWVKIWGIVIGVSCVPFILLFAVPPILVGLTGIVFIPLMFTIIRSRILAERSLLAGVDSRAPAKPVVPLFGENTNWTDLMRPVHVHQRVASMPQQQQQQPEEVQPHTVRIETPPMMYLPTELETLAEAELMKRRAG